MKINKKNCVSVQEWNKLVVETYGRPYNFQQQDGCRDRGSYNLDVPCEYAEDFEHDSVPEVINGRERGVSFAAWLKRDPQKKIEDEDGDKAYVIELFWHRNFYPSIEVVANDLHAKGLLEAGKYLIEIDW
jgi:hypothetical protein